MVLVSSRKLTCVRHIRNLSDSFLTTYHQTQLIFQQLIRNFTALFEKNRSFLIGIGLPASFKNLGQEIPRESLEI